MTAKSDLSGSVDRFAIAVLLGAAASVVPQRALAAWHDDHPGTGIAAHYVRLKSHGGDNETDRKNLVASYKSCAEGARLAGRTAAPPLTVPEFVNSSVVETYYTADRSLTVVQGARYSINITSCALVESPYRYANIAALGTECKIDLIRRRVEGFCDKSPTGSSVGDPLRPLNPLMVPTGEGRSVAGRACQAYASSVLPDFEVCVADPATTADWQMSPAVFFTPPFNSGVPGMLLQARSRLVVKEAEEVQLNISVSPSLFAIPPGFRVNPGATR